MTSVYEYIQYEKYGYLEFEDYTAFLKNIYQNQLGDGYEKSEAFLSDKNAIQKKDTYLENESVQEFISLYKSKGYEIVYMEPVLYKSGKVKPGGTGYLIASIEKVPSSGYGNISPVLSRWKR